MKRHAVVEVDFYRLRQLQNKIHPYRNFFWKIKELHAAVHLDHDDNCPTCVAIRQAEKWVARRYDG